MSGQDTRPCPRCGTPRQSNGGVSSHSLHRAGHLGMHGTLHGSALMMAAGLVGAAARLVYPEKLVCPNPDCGYSTKA